MRKMVLWCNSALCYSYNFNIHIMSLHYAWQPEWSRSRIFIFKLLKNNFTCKLFTPPNKLRASHLAVLPHVRQWPAVSKFIPVP